MPEQPENQVQRVRIEGMECEACKDKVEQALRGIAGVHDVKVHLSEGTAEVAGKAEPEDLIGALSGTDYQATPLGEGR